MAREHLDGVAERKAVSSAYNGIWVVQLVTSPFYGCPINKPIY
jgi:hypothetical protein